ncbi:MAG: sulfite exporter TauE/SafE family protein [Myxococcales bacterium]
MLGLTGPSVTPTNHLFNVVATPSGIARFVRDGRFAWPVAVLITLASLPSSVFGAWARMHFLADPGRFHVLLGVLLGAFAVRLGASALRKPAPSRPESPGLQTRVSGGRLGLLRLEYTFGDQACSAPVPALALISLVVGALGGAAGVGGGALVAPLLVSQFRLPVHSIGGATLLGNFVTSAASLATFALMGTQDALPDWRLGLVLGAGGLCGTYLGASLQRRVPTRALVSLLALGTLALSASYLLRP